MRRSEWFHTNVFEGLQKVELKISLYQKRNYFSILRLLMKFLNPNEGPTNRHELELLGMSLIACACPRPPTIIKNLTNPN